MKQRVSALLLLASMGWLLTVSDQAAEAVRQGLALCAGSVIPALFPFLVLSSLFVETGGAAVLGQRLQEAAGRLLGCSGQGVSVFFLGILGGYPVGGRLVGQLLRAGQLDRQEAEHLLCFCNNAGPAFILGIVGLGQFGSVGTGVWLYLIHTAAAALTGLLLRPKEQVRSPVRHRTSPARLLPEALVDAIAGAGGTMVQICAFVVFFFTLLQLLCAATGVSHPLVWGSIELTQGILQLPPDRSGFIMAAALLGWGGLSVHCQTAAVLRGTGLVLGRYLRAKALHALLAAVLAVFASFSLF